MSQPLRSNVVPLPLKVVNSGHTGPLEIPWPLAGHEAGINVGPFEGMLGGTFNIWVQSSITTGAMSLPPLNDPILKFGEVVLTGHGEYLSLRGNQTFGVILKEKVVASPFQTSVEEASRKSLDTGLDVIFEFLDALLRLKKFAECDRELARIQPEKLSIILQMGFLAVTLRAKSELPSRQLLYQKVFQRVVARDGLDRANELLGKLK